MNSNNLSKVLLAGWTTRNFSIKDLKRYLHKSNPELLEISKDFVNKNVSIKKTYKLLRDYKEKNDLEVSYAGTTDFDRCSEINFSKYLEYLSIQSNQAKFLDSNHFRVLIGGKPNSDSNILRRLKEFEKLISPMNILIEIHGGWESSIENLKKIIEKTNYDFVIDFQNLLKSDLSFEKLNEIINKDRIRYFHSRNLNKDYLEDEKTEIEKKKWINKYKGKMVLWEPKLIGKKKVKELIE